jgi:plastocyanin
MIALALVLAACGGSDPESTDTTAEAQSGAEIVMSNFSYSGDETVAVGASVTVTNEDTVGHTWTSVDNDFDSGTLARGESFEFTFEEAGEYEYFCSIHPQMEGTITVEG